jgi:hypothetical protein
MGADDSIFGQWTTVICGYCGKEILNDLQFIRTNHSGNCIIPSVKESGEKVMADQEKRTGIKNKEKNK